MGKIIFRKKYEPILRQLKEQILKSEIKPDIERVKKILAKTIIHVLDIEGEKLKKELEDK